MKSISGEIPIEETVVYEVAVSVELALPTYAAVYDEDTGDMTVEIELQDYSA